MLHISLPRFVAVSSAMLSLACSSDSKETDGNLSPASPGTTNTVDSPANSGSSSSPIPPASTTPTAAPSPPPASGDTGATGTSDPPAPAVPEPVMAPSGADENSGGSAGVGTEGAGGVMAGGAGGDEGVSEAGGAAGAVAMGGAAGNESTAGGAGGMGAGGMPSESSGMSSGCGTEPTIPSNMYNNGERISIMAAGMQRRYILRVPDNYDNTRAYKLIIAWHQLDGNDVQMYANDYYHLLPLSNDSAIFVAPNGQKNGTPCSTTGNGDGGCGWPNGNGSDIALADAVVNELKENFCIDENRIFATGWSYGGSMSYKTACERGLGGTKDGVEGYIRGIAAYSGAQLSGQCTPQTPVAYYGSHGTSDNVLGYDGGVGLARNFATVNGCNWSEPQRATGNHVCTDVMGCPMDYPVQFCSFTGGHTPDPSDGGGGSWQYQLVWDFFDQF